MNLGLTKKAEELRDRVRMFIDTYVVPVEDEFHAEVGKGSDRWELTPRMTEILEGLNSQARKDGLWNFWLTDFDHR